MLDNKFVALLITLIWMSGLFAIVLTLAYMLQERRKRRRDHRYAWNAARMLAPLYSSLAIFCVGVALHAYAAQQPVSLWVAIVWGMLALFFMLRLAGVAASGIRDGWQSAWNGRQFGLDPVASGRKGSGFSLWSGLSVLLLLVNVALLGWWGNAQISAGALGLPIANRADGENMPAAAPTISPTIPPVETVAVAMSTAEIVVSPSPAGSDPPVGAVLTPTASALPILLPTTTPAPSPATELSMTVRSPTGANVRESPSLTAEVLMLLDDGTVAFVLGRTADNQWFSIRMADGTTGWISSQVIELDGEIESLPVSVAN
ncbi:MAG: SH3 domain-containing protein [Caldilineaceae bacterium]|nr:SH3 domain-containing protein [Caldilineaceae bacterium]